MIAGVGMSGTINALYPQYNVNPVRSMKKLESVDPKEPTQVRADKGDKEEEISSLSVPDEMKNAKQVTYSMNPYDQAKKMAESTLLVGQNLDLVA
ncbi:MAG: hypothetical protein RSB37_09580 [Acetivibrio sp.]